MLVGNALFSAFLEVVYSILNLYIWVIFIGIALSWFVAFGVVNPYNRFVNIVTDFYTRITEPALRPIRKILPAMGGLDLSPMVLLFGIYFLQSFIRHLAV